MFYFIHDRLNVTDEYKRTWYLILFIKLDIAWLLTLRFSEDQFAVLELPRNFQKLRDLETRSQYSCLAPRKVSVESLGADHLTSCKFWCFCPVSLRTSSLGVLLPNHPPVPHPPKNPKRACSQAIVRSVAIFSFIYLTSWRSLNNWSQVGSHGTFCLFQTWKKMNITNTKLLKISWISTKK